MPWQTDTYGNKTWRPDPTGYITGSSAASSQIAGESFTRDFSNPSGVPASTAAPAAAAAPVAAPIIPVDKSFSSATGGRDVSYTGGGANALQAQGGGAGGALAGTTAAQMGTAASQRLAAIRR